MKTSEVNCQECGACCGFPIASEESREMDRDVYLSLDEEEEAQLSKFVAGRRMIRTTKRESWLRNPVALKMVERPGMSEGVPNSEPWVICKALEGSIGCSVSCSIYNIRPKMCRKVKPGDRDCVRARKDAGLPELE